jgi:hypothetical protein
MMLGLESHREMLPRPAVDVPAGSTSGTSVTDSTRQPL